MNTFEDLKIKKPLKNAIADLGFEKPTPIQQESYSTILGGFDYVGIAQTGTGKTIAYLLPILQDLKFSDQLNPRVLILAPTRELVIQIVKEIETLKDLPPPQQNNVPSNDNKRIYELKQTMSYTHQEASAERQKLFQNNLQETQDNFKEHMNVSKPKAIDFADKGADDVDPNAEIKVIYDKHQLVTFDKKTILGLRSQMDFGKNSFIGGTALYYNQSVVNEKVEVGYCLLYTSPSPRDS